MRPSPAVSPLDQQLMGRALAAAKRSMGWTTPNPPVGAVIARDGEVVATGRHRKAGGPHAEVEALRRAGDAARGATCYVTLEPCNHAGRTGPCTEALIEAGISRVVVAALDPNIHVAGGGVQRLREAGILVDTGVRAEEARDTMAPFFITMEKGRPMVTLKMASSLDGCISLSPSSPFAVTGATALREAHRERSLHDAVLVGSGTVTSDDPSLTVRRVAPRGGQPTRVVLDTTCAIDPSTTLVATAREVPTIVVTRRGDGQPAQVLRDAGVDVATVEGAGFGVTPGETLALLGARGIQSVLIEGGGRIARSFLAAGLVDRVVWFVAPLVMGGECVQAVAPGEGGGLPVRLARVTSRRLGNDVVIKGWLEGMVPEIPDEGRSR